MNYDHRFHAGNFADVFKHIVLTRILIYLQRKAAPFRVIDTHAGHGRYDLGRDGAIQEWRSGIARLDPAALSGAARDLITPYLAIVGDAAHGGVPYPGSPTLALRLTRPVDRMIFCDLHSTAVADLNACVGADRRAKVIRLDGYVGLKAFIPPSERRGLVLIDPPFEVPDEFQRMIEAILDAHAKWREGLIMAWHPIKDRRGVEHLAARLAAAGIAKVLRLEFAVDRPRADGRLVSSGLVVVNPPHTLEAEMGCVLPELQRLLGDGRGAWRMASLPTAERGHR